MKKIKSILEQKLKNIFQDKAKTHHKISKDSLNLIKPTCFEASHDLDSDSCLDLNDTLISYLLDKI